MKNTPLVSICVPCYNHEKYLDNHMESIINQSYQNIEYIIVDDCSNDNSREIIKKWLPELRKKFKRVLFIKNDINLGVSKTSNILVSYAKGELVKPFASDDMLLPFAIERLVELSNAYPDADLYHANAYQVSDEYSFSDDYEGYPHFLSESSVENIIQISKKNNIFLDLMEDSFICTPTYLVKHSVYERYGGYNENLKFEDGDFFLQIAANGGKFVFTKDCLVLYRKSENSLSNYLLGSRLEKYENFLEENKGCLDRFIDFVPKDKQTHFIQNHYKSKLEVSLCCNLRGIFLKNYIYCILHGIAFPLNKNVIYFKWFFSPLKKWLTKNREE